MAPPVTLPGLDQLDQATVDLYRRLLVAVMEEYNPQLDLNKRGPVHDLVLHPRAVLSAAQEYRLQAVFRSGSLRDIAADPTLADPDVVDRVLSNFRLTRRPGAPASGQVAVVLSSQTPVVVPRGTVFVIKGQTFAAADTFAARAPGQNLLGPNDRPLAPVPNGFAFSVDVAAAQNGSAGNVTYGSLAAVAQPPPRFVQAYAAADFAGGADQETNDQLLARLSAGLAAQGWSSRPGVESLLRAVPALAGLKAVSVVGFGDPEMTRDRHALWPGSLGGRCDLYLRADDLKTVVLTRQAVLVSRSGSVGTWQVGLGRDDAPGYYEVKSVLPAGADPSLPSLVVTQETRGLDASGPDVPDVVTALEAAYSRYQTAVVQFADPSTDAAGLTPNVAQLPYTLALRAVPLLADAQDYLGQPQARPPAGDVLVRAPVPCFLKVSFTAAVRRGQTPPAASSLQQAVAAFVNGLGFPGGLTASAVSQVIHNAAPAVSGLTLMSLQGRIRQPDGTMVNITSGDSLTVPDTPAVGVTAQTVSFFLDPDDVTVTLSV